MKNKSVKKLLLVGSQTIHTYNYLELVQDYFDDILLITDHRREGYTYRTVECDFSLSLKNIRSTVKEIRRQILDFQPSVIHIHQANSFAFYTLLANKSLNIPTILTAWGSDILLNPRRNILLKAMTRFNLIKADFLTSDSVYMAEEMKKLVPSLHEILIANFGIGIDPIPVEKENIIYSNRLHKKLYRIDKIIAAFHAFQQNNKEWKLVIAATGEETENLKKQVSELGIEHKVEFAGWVDKVQNQQYYSLSKIWVSIPESDATSISLLEAMISRCIPVVSDLPANHEWIEDNKNGVIATNVEEDFIQRALLIDYNKAVEINVQRIEKDGTKEANREKFLKLYQSIISND